MPSSTKILPSENFKIDVSISKKKYPSLYRRILLKIFPNHSRPGYKWYHNILPNKFLKLFGKEYKPYRYKIKCMCYDKKENIIYYSDKKKDECECRNNNLK